MAGLEARVEMQILVSGYVEFIPATTISSGRVFMINSRAQKKLLHTWIISFIAKQHLVEIDRIDGPIEYLS